MTRTSKARVRSIFARAASGQSARARTNPTPPTTTTTRRSSGMILHGASLGAGTGSIVDSIIHWNPGFALRF